MPRRNPETAPDQRKRLWTKPRHHRAVDGSPPARSPPRPGLDQWCTRDVSGHPRRMSSRPPGQAWGHIAGHDADHAAGRQRQLDGPPAAPENHQETAPRARNRYTRAGPVRRSGDPDGGARADDPTTTHPRRRTSRARWSGPKA